MKEHNKIEFIYVSPLITHRVEIFTSFLSQNLLTLEEQDRRKYICFTSPVGF